MNLISKNAYQFLLNHKTPISELAVSFGKIDKKQKTGGFHQLSKIIVNQQLSDKAANTIFSRLQTTCDEKTISPARIMVTPFENLRACGLSKLKTEYIIGLAGKMKNDPLFSQRLETLSFKDAKSEITNIRGFGEWSAEIYLLFYLGHADVFPSGDVTLSKAFHQLFEVQLNSVKGHQIMKSLTPYRSAVSIYLWHWHDNGYRLD